MSETVVSPPTWFEFARLACLLVVGPAFGVAGARIARTRGMKARSGALVGFGGANAGWFSTGFLSIALHLVTGAGLPGALVIGSGFVTGALAVRALAARGTVAPAARKQDLRVLAGIGAATLALSALVIVEHRRAFTWPARLALPDGATVLSERAWEDGFLPDFRYELDARMTRDAFLEWATRLELYRVAEHPETWERKPGGECAARATFESDRARFTSWCW